MSDQCSVINNVELVKLPPPATIELIKIVTSGSAGSAEVRVAGEKQIVRVGDMIKTYKLIDILPDSLLLEDPATGLESYLAKLDD